MVVKRSAPKQKASFELKAPAEYRKGPEGFISWVEDNCAFPIYPEGSDIPIWQPAKDLPPEYLEIWEGQKTVVHEALRMENNRFVHRLIVLCWMRGEGKSFLACLIQLWKFFNWPRQQIVLGANSKEQTKFVHYDIMRDIILNSPRLVAIVGRKNVQEKRIVLKNSKGETVSEIKAISSFSGIVSNITGYTFSEMFDMKNPKFYVQLDGSTRNIPNALGVIDSTVSAKTHVLFKLYTTFINKKDPTLYFSYRSSPLGKSEDFWNPYMSQVQLDSYREKFPFGEFERYFMNSWEAGAKRIFTDEMVDAIGYLGIDGEIGNHPKVIEALEKKFRIIAGMEDLKKSRDKHPDFDFFEQKPYLDEIQRRLIPVENYYHFERNNSPYAAPREVLSRLGDVYDTGWVILTGFDRSDPMAIQPSARTIFTCLAKGLPGSRRNPFQFYNSSEVPKFIYFYLCVEVMEKNTLDEMKRLVSWCDEEYGGVDALCTERWGAFDLAPWCEENDIKAEFVSPSYDKQRTAFSELYTIYKHGLIKSPIVNIPGSKEDDLLREEAKFFTHDPDKKWFGSPEKSEKKGIQDDCMYASGWCVYGGRDLGIDDLRERKSKQGFGLMIHHETNLLGSYS